ncbi:hypothetical protein Tco_0294120 [Tanacetum coccineum]
MTTKDIHAMKEMESKEKEKCMVYFRSLHSHLKVHSNKDLKGTRIQDGFKRAFISLFGQDVKISTNSMFLNVDQLEKQLEKKEFQENGSTAAFRVLMTQKSFVERAQYKREHDSRVNERQMQMHEGKVDIGKALDDGLVITESSGTKSEK